MGKVRSYLKVAGVGTLGGRVTWTDPPSGLVRVTLDVQRLERARRRFGAPPAPPPDSVKRLVIEQGKRVKLQRATGTRHPLVKLDLILPAELAARRREGSKLNRRRVGPKLTREVAPNLLEGSSMYLFIYFRDLGRKTLPVAVPRDLKQYIQQLYGVRR